MRYIRTKNGRIIDLDRIVYGDKVFHLNENEIENDSWSGWYWYSKEYGYELECRDVDIIKQADTIEELCDAFVYAKCDYMELEEAKREKEWNESEWQQDGLPIYGAIWTGKGLIYVAKMNEKGELELL